MARDDWVALVTDPAAEYVVRTELERFDLRPYMPQLRKRWTGPHTGTTLMRRYPLFPRYILLPLRDTERPALRICRGLRRAKPILCDAEGRPWRATNVVIDAVKEAEAHGDFDMLLERGDSIQLAKGVLAGVKAVLTATARHPGGQVEMLLPLFGGVKAFVPQGNVARV